MGLITVSYRCLGTEKALLHSVYSLYSIAKCRFLIMHYFYWLKNCTCISHKNLFINYNAEFYKNNKTMDKVTMVFHSLALRFFWSDNWIRHIHIIISIWFTEVWTTYCAYTRVSHGYMFNSEARWRIYVSVIYANIGSDNGLWPGRLQAII